MLISHRINYLGASNAPRVFAQCDGIEFDLRDSAGILVVVHDALTPGQPFCEFLTFCDPSKFYIVNIKCEGIEAAAISLLEARGIRNFFLLDCSIPAMIRLGKAGEKRLAVRFSEYESLQTVECMKSFVSWVWIDTFTRLPITADILETFKRHGLKTCLVSPELQQQPERIEEYIADMKSQGLTIDAVCTKAPYLATWRLSSLFPCPS